MWNREQHVWIFPPFCVGQSNVAYNNGIDGILHFYRTNKQEEFSAACKLLTFNTESHIFPRAWRRYLTKLINTYLSSIELLVTYNCSYRKPMAARRGRWTTTPRRIPWLAGTLPRLRLEYRSPLRPSSVLTSVQNITHRGHRRPKQLMETRASTGIGVYILLNVNDLHLEIKPSRTLTSFENMYSIKWKIIV